MKAGKRAARGTRSSREHHGRAQARLRYALLTVSDTRSKGNDEAGDRMEEFLAAADLEVVERRWCVDEVDELREALERLLDDERIDVIVATGGTGISPRDVTPEAMRPLLSKELPGFGEAFRRLSWEEVGAASVASRALAGVAARAQGAKLVFCLPGSPDACLLALDQIILPEAPHLHDQANRRHGEAHRG